MSIEGIALENFSALTKADINSTTLPHQRYAIFQSFLFYNSKQDAATTNSHSKHLISVLKEKKLMTKAFSTIWGNTYGCDEQYICASALYLMSVMS